MSKWIDADALIAELKDRWNKCDLGEFAENVWSVIEDAPSIDIVRCKECKYGEYRDDFDDYECHSSGCGLVNDADFYCADGERREP